MKEKNMNKIFYISDAHISHSNVLKFDNRPFATIEENDRVIMENWNAVVDKNDIVYTLGDMHWGKAEEVYEYVKQLNGRKICIKGNHTLKQFPAKLRNLFEDVCDYKEITDNGRHVIMCHYPILCYKGSYDPKTYMLHGHTHQTREQRFVEKWTRELKNSKRENSDSCGNIINVGVMMPYMNYTPRTLDEILEGHND